MEKETYDQYIQFERLPVLLKRFSFEEKMRICNKYSRQALSFENAANYENLKDIPLPWCIETFAMLSLEAKEYDNDNFLGKNEKKFLKMYNAIWNYVPKVLEGQSNTLTFVDYLIPVTALTQFSLQESFWIKYYRYWRLLTDDSAPIHICNIFRKKFGADYYDYLLFGIYLKMLCSIEADLPMEIIEYFSHNKFHQVFQHLVITRDKYVDLLKEFVSNSMNKSEYIYCVRPSYQYPFIQYNEFIYFPLPHLLTQNFTSSLLYRMTDGDNNLREKMGKYILETYLLNIVEEANIYDEVFPECTYKGSGGTESKSPDVLAKQGMDVLFLDSKSTAPSKGIRLFEESAYDKNIKITAKNIVKLYKQIKNFSVYNPFLESVSDNINNYWGIVVVLEDSYIRRGKIYEEVYHMLSLSSNSIERQWLATHIKIVGLYEIERLCLCSCSIIEMLKKQIDAGNSEDYFPSGTIEKDTKFTNQDFLSFKTKVMTDIDMITKELEENGLIC